MPELIIRRGGQKTSVTVPAGTRLHEALEAAGISVFRPCGGRGVCGKCAVTVTGALSPRTAEEEKRGLPENRRLACQTDILGDAVVTIEDAAAMTVETAAAARVSALAPMGEGYGAAVDIGTTTVVLRVYDCSDGRLCGEAASENPQGTVAADVMGRIGAAMNGSGTLLQTQILGCISALLSEACRAGGIPEEQVTVMVLCGNTTMLYLLTGQNPEPLSHAPFSADTLFDCETVLLGRRAYLPSCMDAFVGADITCAVLASGMCERDETALLCDLGTNGELALWKNGVLYVTSTAAGPAFEGAGISCGCRSIPGAVDRVVPGPGGTLAVHTIGDRPAVGVCGSGLIDAIAAGLDVGLIDETGALEDDDLPLSANGGTVVLEQKDIRAVQLAKAAIAAGTETLLGAAQTKYEDVKTVYLAGGFGSHLDIPGAVRIGLLHGAFRDRVKVIGNGALAGAELLLLDAAQRERCVRIAGTSHGVKLGGDPVFNAAYMEQMLFPDGDED